ncbi:hypothetical protein ACHWQZ_G010611 [Mnemiopsis leidyi]
MKEEAAKQNENASADSRKRISKVKVALTLGHSASHRAKADLTGSGDYTHDWSFYVRGDPGCKIHNYIDRVVFKLHDTFPNPVQVIKKPPYEIHEQGYGTFILAVEVNFKNKREPRQIEYKYDLVLPADGVPPIKRCRKEILTFTNPNSEFMTKLIDGGGVLQQGNLLPNTTTKQSPRLDPPRESTAPSPSINKNKEQPSKPSKEQEERRAAKERRKEKRKERKVIEEEEDDMEDVRARKKEKKKERIMAETEEKVRHKSAPIADPEPSQGGGKEPKKHKKSSRPESSGSSMSFSRDAIAEKKPKSEDKQKQKISSVLAAIGDVESSDDEKYFKDSPQREPIKREPPLDATSSKKIPPKSLQKEKPKRTKPADAFLEFDSVEDLKVKKKLKSKQDKTPANAQPEVDRKPNISIKEEKVRPIKQTKVEKDVKPTKKYSSSNSDEESKPVTTKPDDTFLEFDNISTLKPKKKSHEKHQIKAEYHENYKQKPKEEELPKTKEKKKKDLSKHMKESEKPRKRSSSFSADTEDNAEEDGEIKTPSSDFDIDADEAVVARILGMEPEEKTPQKPTYKGKKNKHKAIKKDPDTSWKTPDVRGETTEGSLTKIKSESSSRYSASPAQPGSSSSKQDKTLIEGSSSKQSRSFSKPPDFHRAPPEQDNTTIDHQYPSSSSHRPELSPSSPRLRSSESSLEQDTIYRPNQVDEYSSEPETSTIQDPSSMSAEHLRFMLNIYNKIHQLQKTDDRGTISEIVNILSTHRNSNMVIKDENVTFDLVNCDLETLHSIDSVLS